MIKNLLIILLILLNISCQSTDPEKKNDDAPKNDNLIFSVDFENRDEFEIGGGFSKYWDIAPLEGISTIPSNFVKGGSQEGKIFFGSYAKGPDGDPVPTITIKFPDLTKYINLYFTVSLAAPDGTRNTSFEVTHRDSLIISGSNGEIDSFLPVSSSSPLRSKVHSVNLHYDFKDFKYNIDNNITYITFSFASTDYDEVIGIDSINVYGEIPDNG